MPGKRAGATFPRENRHEFRYLLAIRIADLLSWIIWLIPKSVRYWLADRVADTFRSMTHTYRDNVEANVAQVVGQPVDSDVVQRATSNIFRLSSRNFVDLMTIPRASRRKLIATLTVKGGGWAMVDDAVAQGRGVIMV